MIALTSFDFASMIRGLRALASGEAFSGNMGAIALTNLGFASIVDNRLHHRTFTEIIL